MATTPSSARATADPMLHVLMGMLVTSVAGDGPDLTARQLAVFLKVYLEPNADHTMRGLAAVLNGSKPAITRALDWLEELDFSKREQDRLDRRSPHRQKDTCRLGLSPHAQWIYGRSGQGGEKVGAETRLRASMPTSVSPSLAQQEGIEGGFTVAPDDFLHCGRRSRFSLAEGAHIASVAEQQSSMSETHAQQPVPALPMRHAP
jgi:hypothetical protein